MAKYGWVPATRNMREKVVNLRKYFEVVSLAILENDQITKIACRRLAMSEKSDLALIAWTQEAKLKAREMQTGKVNIKGLASLIPEIWKQTNTASLDCFTRTKDILAKHGIALVCLPHLKGSSLQGATFMDGNRIVVGLVTEKKDAEKIRFNLFHELAHIVLGHVGKTGGTSEEEEKAADEWAAEKLTGVLTG